MTEQQLALDLYAALAAGDADGVRRVLHPDFEGQVTDGMPLGVGGAHAGPEDMRRNVWWRIGRAMTATVRAERFHTVDDGQLLVLGHYVFDGTDDAVFAHLIKVQDGQIIRLEQVTDSHRWWQAAEAAQAAVTCDIVEGLAHIRLNRPDKRNSIDEAFVAGIDAAVEKCADEPGLRAVLITAAGPAFCVGGDVNLFAGTDPADLSRLLTRMTRRYHDALVRLTRLDAPVVCAVHGSVAGGGLGIAHCSDIVVAAEGTKFALGFGRLGIAGDGGSTWFLPRKAGHRRATEAFLENRVLDADEALDWGIVTRVVPPDEVEADARATAERLAAGPTRAYAEMRALLRASSTQDLPEQLAAETRALGRAGATQDAAEGFRAFHDKRTPKFEGR